MRINNHPSGPFHNMVSLLTIPLELLVAVSVHLPTTDLCALRLTCKQIEKSLYEWFSKEFFTKKQFMLTFPSLQALVDISKHVSFSKKLSHVIIAINHYESMPLRFRNEEAAARYIQGYEDQQALFCSGLDREMLTEAFKSLSNLDTIGIRDFSSNNRYRDGDRASWSSWGSTTVYSETGVQLAIAGGNPDMGGIGSSFTTRIFQIVVHALGKAKRNPRAIEVLLRHNILSDRGLYIPDYMRPTILPVLQNLKTLLLNISVSTMDLHTHSNGTRVLSPPGRSLRRFLGCTVNLTHLRLNFEKQPQWVYNEQFLLWLSLPPPASSGLQEFNHLNPDPIALPLLAQLDLGQMNVEPHYILNVIQKFAPTLRDLSFWRMSLRTQSAAQSPGINLWAGLFSKLTTMPHLQLNHLLVGFISQDRVHVNFKTPDIEDAPLLKKKDSMGKEMSVFLKELEEEAVVLWPNVINDDGDSDEDMEDDEDQIEGLDDEDDDDDEEEEEE
jgi:hypothetical protein